MASAVKLPLFLLGAVSVGAGAAEAAGFAIKEQDAEAQGASFAGVTAGYGGLGAMFFNPAAQGLAEGRAGEAVVSYARATFEVSGASGSTVVGSPLGGQAEFDDSGIDALIPALYLTTPVSEQLRFGLAISAPFGLGTDYDDGWVGRYHAQRSELLSLAATPSLAWTPAPWLSLGAGLTVQYAKAKLSNAIDFGTIALGVNSGGAVGGITPAPGGQDGGVRVEGEDVGFGITLGALVEPRDGTRIGIGFRSAIDHELHGDADFDVGASGMGAVLSAASGQFVDTDVTAPLDLPGTVSFGLTQALGERLTLLGEVQWTGWHTFDTLQLEFENTAQADSVTREDWEDSWFYAIGLDWKATDTLSLRAGIAYDESPVPDGTRTPRVPDTDRTWLSLGLTWSPSPAMALTAGYSRIILADGTIALAASDTGNRPRGNLEADVEGVIDILAIGGRLRF